MLVFRVVFTLKPDGLASTAVIHTPLEVMKFDIELVTMKRNETEKRKRRKERDKNGENDDTNGP